MSEYEKYYKGKCEALEANLLFLISQRETDREIQAVHEIEYRKEAERLKQENKNLDQMYNKIRHTLSNQNADLMQENKKLKEALRKCEPWNRIACAVIECNFCGYDGRHSDDCEYIKLCGEGEHDNPELSERN